MASGVPLFVERAMEQAADAMATMKESTVIQPGIHFNGRYYFCLAGSNELYVVRWRPAAAPSLTLNANISFQREPIDDDPMSRTLNGDILSVATTQQMPAQVAVAMMEGARNG